MYRVNQTEWEKKIPRGYKFRKTDTKKTLPKSRRPQASCSNLKIWGGYLRLVQTPSQSKLPSIPLIDGGSSKEIPSTFLTSRNLSTIINILIGPDSSLHSFSVEGTSPKPKAYHSPLLITHHTCAPSKEWSLLRSWISS